MFAPFRPLDGLHDVIGPHAEFVSIRGSQLKNTRNSLHVQIEPIGLLFLESQLAVHLIKVDDSLSFVKLGAVLKVVKA